MYCKYCGQRISAKDSKKCPSCGANINIYDYGQSFYDDRELDAWKDKSSSTPSAAARTIMPDFSTPRASASAPRPFAPAPIPETTMRKAAPDPMPSAGVTGFFSKNRLLVIICSISAVLFITLIAVAIIAFNKGGAGDTKQPDPAPSSSNSGENQSIERSPINIMSVYNEISISDGYGFIKNESGKSIYLIKFKVNNKEDYSIEININDQSLHLYEVSDSGSIQIDSIDPFKSNIFKTNSIVVEESAFTNFLNKNFILSSKQKGETAVPVDPANAGLNTNGESNLTPSSAADVVTPPTDPSTDIQTQNDSIQTDTPAENKIEDKHFTFDYNNSVCYADAIIDGGKEYICVNDVFDGIEYISKPDDQSSVKEIKYHFYKNNYDGKKITIDFADDRGNIRNIICSVIDDNTKEFTINCSENVFIYDSDREKGCGIYIAKEKLIELVNKIFDIQLSVQINPIYSPGGQQQ